MLKILLAVAALIAFQLTLEYFVVSGSESVAFIGGIIRAIGAGEQKKRLKNELGSFDFDQRMEDILGQRGLLDIDRSQYDDFINALEGQVGFADQELGRATLNAMMSGGQPLGVEEARRSARTTTANILDNAMDFVGDPGSLANILGFAQAQGNQAQLEISQDAARRAEQNQRFAEQVRSGAVSNRMGTGSQLAGGIFDVANANRDLDLLEYQENQLNPFLQVTQDRRDLEAALRGARAAQTEAWGGFADGLFNTALSVGTGGLSGPGGGFLSGFNDIFK